MSAGPYDNSPSCRAVVHRASWHYLNADTQYRIQAAHLKVTMESKKMSVPDETSQCVAENCNKILGRESRDLGFKLCHEHRNCIQCGKATNATESNYCLEHSLPIQHARCMKIADGQTMDLKVAIANCTRLMTSITLNIGAGAFEDQYVWLRTLQENAAQTAVLVNEKNKAELKKRIESEAKTEQKVAESKRRETVAKATPVERKHLTNAAKAITALTNVGVPYGAAAKSIMEQEMKRGTPADKARAIIIEAMISLKSNADDAEAILDGRLN